MDTGLDFLVGVAAFLSVAAIVKVVSDNRIRHKLIDKGMVDESLKYLYVRNLAVHPLSYVRWGLVLVAISLPLLFEQFFPLVLSSEGIIGFMLLFAGIGFFIYYSMAKKEEMQNNGPEE